MKRAILAVFLLAGCAFAQNSPMKSIPINSAPAAGSQATASIGAADNIRHVVDKVCFSGSSHSAPSATALTINIRDGATGAGTVLASFSVEVLAAAGQNVAPFCTQQLDIEGSNNTALTAEWSASLANLSETVTLYYHNVPAN